MISVARTLTLAAAMALSVPSLAEQAALSAALAIEGNETPASGRPFRIGMWKLNQALDWAKPLAVADPAGWAFSSELLIGAFDEKWVGAFSPTTGRVEWWLEAPANLTSPPGTFGSWVVLGFRDGTVMKVEALTGKKVWSAKLESFTERAFTLSGTTLFVVSAAQVLHALDFQTGKTLWLFDGGFPDGLSIRGGARPIVHEGKVLFGVATGEILAVNLVTGKLLWRYNPKYSDRRFHDVVGEMVMINDKLVLSRYDGFVAAIDLASATRQVTWQQEFPGVTTSAFRGGRFYVGTIMGDVYAIDAESGRVLWRKVTGGTISTLTAGETTLFVGGSDGLVMALDTADGDLLWHDYLGGDLSASPALVEDRIYFATGIKTIYGYKVR